MPATATVSFLFVDVVGSTALLHRLGEVANDELRARYKPVLRDAVARHGGHEVKNLGDGLMAAFPTSAASCVAAAIAMHQGVDRLFRSDPLLDLQLRIGISTGEALHLDDDWSGTPVVEAARLESAARPGTILANDLVRSLLGRRGDFEFVRVGGRSLKGFPDPVSCVEVVWQPGEATSEVPLPGALRDVGGPPFIGRGAELDQLLTSWKLVLDTQQCSAVRLSGAHGSGKLRLVQQFASMIHSERAAVVFGRGEDAPSEPARAWAEGLRWWSSSVPLDTLRAAVADRGPNLLSVVPALDYRLPEYLSLPVSTSGERTLDAVARTILEIARICPLVFVIDAPRTIDRSTQEVLDQLLDSTDASLLVVLIDSADSLSHVPCRTIPIGPLHEDEVEDLIRSVIGSSPVVAGNLASIARRVRSETDGSPRSVIEVSNRLDEGGAFGLPAGVRREDALRSALLSTSPYKGLLSYGSDDAELFFGRDDEVASILGRLRAGHFLAVTGPSGCGKSSLVRAGMLPSLAEGALAGSTEWRTAVFTPGSRPMLELAAALAIPTGERVGDVLAQLELGLDSASLMLERTWSSGADAKLLVVIDQFEEIFTLCADDGERRRFIDLILHGAARSAGRMMVVVVVRADFFAQCTTNVGLAAAFETSTFIVGRMGEADVRSVIESPARTVGLSVDPDLTEAMLGDVASEPGALPLLSHALFETWKRREGHRLTLAGYRDSGRVSGAIAATAEAVYITRLNLGTQRLARELFLRLTELGEGTEDTRRRVSRQELGTLTDSPADMTMLLDELTSARLVTVAEETVEVAHEALIREWPRLRQWLDEDRAALRSLRHLTQAATDWELGGRDDADLYGAPRIAAVAAVAERARLTSVERDFLDSSNSLIERSARRERTTNRRLRRLLAAALVTTALLVVASGAAFRQRGVAESRASEARESAADADFERLLSQSQALRPTDRSTALLLALEAERARSSPASRSALLAALQGDPSFLGYFPVGAVPSGSAVLDDGTLLVGTADGQIEFLDPRMGDPAASSLDLGSDSTILVADDPTRSTDGPVVATNVADGTVWRIDPSSHQVMGAPISVGQGVLAVAASERLDLVAVAREDSSVALWRLSDGSDVGQILSSPDTPSPSVDDVPEVGGAGAARASEPVLDDVDVNALAFSPIAAELTVQWPGGALQRWDSSTLVPVSGRFSGLPLGAGVEANRGHLQYSPDGTTLLRHDVGLPAERQAVDVTSGEVLWEVRGHSGPVAFLDEVELIRLSQTGSIERVATRSGALVETVADSQFTSGAVGLHVSGSEPAVTILSGHRSVVAAWSMVGDGPVRQRIGSGAATPIEVSPDGTRVLVFEGDYEARQGSLSVRSLPSGELIAEDLPMDVALFAGGSGSVLGASIDGTVGVYDLDAKAWASSLAFDLEGFVSADVSPEGLVAVGRKDGTIELFELDGEQLSPSIDSGEAVGGIHFDSDGSNFLIYQSSGVTVYSTSTRRPIGPTIADVRSVSFLPGTNDLVVSRDGRGIERVDPVSGRSTPMRFDAATGEYRFILVSPDSRYLRMTLAGEQAQLFDMATAEPVGDRFDVLQRGDAWFSGGGSHLVVAGNDGLEVWDVRPESWVTTACQIAGRNLSELEWEKYMPNAGERRPTCEQWSM